MSTYFCKLIFVGLFWILYDHTNRDHYLQLFGEDGECVGALLSGGLSYQEAALATVRL